MTVASLHVGSNQVLAVVRAPKVEPRKVGGTDNGVSSGRVGGFASVVKLLRQKNAEH
jgi:hypothetical protein